MTNQHAINDPREQYKMDKIPDHARTQVQPIAEFIIQCRIEQPFSDNIIIRIIFRYVVIIFNIIFVVSIFCIRNTGARFQIDLTTQQNGMR